MKLTINRIALDRAVSNVGRAISGKSTMPILSHVAGVVKDGTLRLTASNLEMWIECTCPVSGDLLGGDGDFALPYDRLSSLVSAFTGADVVIDRADGENKARVSCGRSDCVVLSLPFEEFPGVPESEKGCTFTMPATVLKGALRHTMFAVSVDDKRPLLCGVHVVATIDSVTFVSTDTHRCAERKVALTRPAVGGSTVTTIPVKPLSEVMRIAEDGSDINVTLSQNFARFEIVSGVDEDKSPIVIVSRIIEGQYPNYQRIIPTHYDRRMTLDVADLSQALKRISVFAKDNANRVVLETDGGTLRLSAQSGVTGSISDEVEMQYEGEPITLAVNSIYLMAFLASVGTEAITLELTEPLRPGVARPVGGDDLQYLYVVMPMQLNGD